MVRDYKGSHSGEHGDGIVRSEFHENMFGAELVRAFEEVKDRFDPNGLFNPGKIVRAPKFDDRANFRFGPNYRIGEVHARARLVRLSRPRGRLLRRRRDVQQQRRMPEARRRRDVPVLPRHPRRARRDAWPRQQLAAGAVGAAGRRMRWLPTK